MYKCIVKVKELFESIFFYLKMGLEEILEMGATNEVLLKVIGCPSPLLKICLVLASSEPKTENTRIVAEEFYFHFHTRACARTHFFATGRFTLSDDKRNMKAKDSEQDSAEETTEKPLYKSLTTKSHPYVYLRLQLTIEGESEISPTKFKFTVMEAVKETLGQVGGGIPIDILKLLEGGQALLRVPSRYSEKVWGALTLFGRNSSEKLCAFTVLQASPFLICLADDSRQEKRDQL